jgi:hypothetical protein
MEGHQHAEVSLSSEDHENMAAKNKPVFLNNNHPA